MATLQEIIYLSSEQYQTLYSTGTVTIDGITLTYDPDHFIYCVPDEYYEGEATGAFDIYTVSLS